MVGFNSEGNLWDSPRNLSSVLFLFCGFVIVVLEGRSGFESKLKKLKMLSFRIPKVCSLAKLICLPVLSYTLAHNV